MRDITKTLCFKWFYEVWNESRESSIDSLMGDQANAYGILTPDQPKGAAGFKAFYRGFKEKYDNIKIDIKDVIAQDDMESALTDVTAIHRETGKKVNFSGIVLVRVQNGKIAEAWNHYDFLSLYQQLGKIPEQLS
jgi:predicted ester cyclase